MTSLLEKNAIKVSFVTLQLFGTVFVLNLICSNRF